MSKNNNKILATLLGSVVLLSVFFANNNFAQGATGFDTPQISTGFDPMAIKVNDKASVDAALKNVAATQKADVNSQGNFFKQLWADTTKWAKDVSWSGIFQSTLSSALNKIAYDSATWLGSGGKGQKPMFITEGWGEYLANVGDNAAGTFVEELGKKGFNGQKYNLCSPDFDVQVQIGLGLMNTYRPKTPACTFSQLKKNWEEEITKPDFLNKFQNMFQPSENDLGIALSLQTGIMEEKKLYESNAEKERSENKGWLDVNKGISKIRQSSPGEAERQRNQLDTLILGNFAKYTGSALTDAANIFLNQLALSSFNTLMRELGKNGDSSTHPFDWSNLQSFTSGGGNGTAGITATKSKLKKLTKPKFDTRGDYNILTELTQCQDPAKAGPTNCVIDDKFSQAIAEKKTVGKALTDGNLNSSGVFGFLSSHNLEPNYNEGYPYRSMLILRKFRIIPSSWELAAEYLKEHPEKAPKTLGDLVNCYDADDDYGKASDTETWCEGLVDPRWVLKAPLNYCKKEGPGPEILSSSASDDKLTVTRNDNYCADEQSCVKENADGSCKLYGYCTEEHRKWKFGTDNCDATFNTCESFSKSDGEEVAYLKNTLDYNGCSVDNAGCAAYCTDFDYNSGKFNCTSSSAGDKIYLDRDAQTCDSKSEGCTALIRTKESLGVNLAVNSSFENDLNKKDWNASVAWSDLGMAVADSFSGTKSMKFKAAGSYSQEFTVSPSIGYSVKGEIFSLSFYAKNCNAGSNFKIDGQPEVKGLVSDANWTLMQTSHLFESDSDKVRIVFDISNNDCKIDSLKLERSRTPTKYDEYGNNGLVYEKLAPEYLNCTGASSDPAECKKFALRCDEKSVGCEMYSSVNSNEQIPAKVKSGDYCTAECVGFDTYIQSDTAFDSLRPEYFIPKTGKACSAQANGCDQFTNLDKLSGGGESTEYYSYLRQCIKPSASTCSDYYMWEGSAESGYQLKVMNLKSAGNQPAITGSAAEESAKCNATIYKLNPTDPAYNSDCREFYDASGNKTYHLYTQTVSCSEDCHPFRRTELNTDPNISQAACVGSDRSWSAEKQECILCKNGGKISDDKKSCIYEAVPSQGVACAAAENGCREYTGNTGQNTRIVINDDFEDGTSQGWNYSSAPLAVSTESINNGGHSLQVNNSGAIAGKEIGSLIQNGKSYVLSFIAKGSGQITPSINSETALIQSFSTITISGGDWNKYQINIEKLAIPGAVTGDESLVLDGTSSFYIDNIKLTEITDRYYMIKESWQTPESCNQDLFGNPQALYMLGCDEYKDRENKTHYLKSFSSLCSESAVGCELMINTQNSNSPEKQDFNTADALSRTTVSDDNYIYAIYDKNKLCDRQEKGCQRLGKLYIYDGKTLYQDIFLKNNPDDYGKTMCVSDAVNCNEYKTSTGMEYFKDPGDMACEWRSGYQSVLGWYKKKIKRCDGAGDVCLTDKDCTGGKTCKLETKDTLCDTDANGVPKTLGSGNARIIQPQNGWAGYCSTEESGCTELIDPLSEFSNNLFFNPSFSNLDNNASTANDGWPGNKQQVTLERSTLYRLAGTGSGSDTITLNCSNIFEFNPVRNSLNTPTNSLALNLSADQKSKYFYSGNNTGCSAVIVNSGNAKVELKKAVVDYQIAGNLDKSSCNGLVNGDDGCVLFNQRAVNGTSTSEISYDADARSDTPTNASAQAADSNVLLKVTPDRVCDKWLACKTLVGSKNETGGEENTCLDIGMCVRADDSGKCTNFVKTEQNNLSYNYTSHTPSNVNNLSGYTKIGSASADAQNNYFPIAAMSQEGELARVMNGNFELYSSTGYPIGWKNDSNKTWNESNFAVISGPANIQKEGIIKTPEGGSVLKAGVTEKIDSEIVYVGSNADYILSANINTLNLEGSASRAYVNVIDKCNGNNLGSVYLDAGKDWKQFSTRLNHSACGRVMIQLATNSTYGNYYVDDIRLRPSLAYKKSSAGNNLLTPQSCRLYPKSDALSCEYSDSSGYLNAGWWGYCLEYDRYPGNPDACILWWPGEKIRGDSFNEMDGYSGGYNDKYPAYYCDNLDANFRFVEKRTAKLIKKDEQESSSLFGVININTLISGAFSVVTAGLSDVMSSGGFIDLDLVGGLDGTGAIKTCPVTVGYTVDVQHREYDTGFIIETHHSDTYYYCLPKGYKFHTVTAGEDNNEWGGGAWYEYNGNLVNWENPLDGSKVNTEIDNGVRILDLDKGELVAPKDFDYLGCKSFYQTVGIGGENKAWTGRMNDKYVVPILKYEYGTDDKPFGSAVPPEPAYNPYDWDGNSKFGRQPIEFKVPESKNVRSGSPYRCVGGKCYRIGHCSDSGNTCVNVLPNNDGCGTNLSSMNQRAWGDLSPNPTGFCYANTTNRCNIATWVTTTTNTGITCPPGTVGYNGGSWLLDAGVPENTEWRTVSKASTTNQNVQVFKQPYLGCSEDESCLIDVEETQNAANNTTPEESLKRLFAKSYGHYVWNEKEKRYLDDGTGWDIPTAICAGGVRPAAPNDWCGVVPTIPYINVSNSTLTTNGLIKLSFTSVVDVNQMPLVYYKVDWGDGTETVVSGEMFNKQNEKEPHYLYHYFDYWDLKGRNACNAGATDTSCKLRARVMIRDNWGLESGWKESQDITINEF